jgi:hypothetical protein
MGAIAEAIVAFAKPLFDQTDGSLPQMQRAMLIAQACWNFALMPEDKREKAIDEIKPTLNMTDEEFAEFRQLVVLPMIRRHSEMFPGLHGRSEQTRRTSNIPSSPAKKLRGPDRYAPCSCGSGRKYKWCCGAQK